MRIYIYIYIYVYKYICIHKHKQDLSVNEKGEKLHQAVQDGNLDTVVQLLQDGADVNWKDGNVS